ncbi:MAG: hypothetical protein WBG48_07675 [Pricia sp.]
MFGNFIGERIKRLRDEVYGLTQSEFADELNQYIWVNHKKHKYNSQTFIQNHISLIEQKNQIKRDKFALLLNFLYASKRINPAWIVIEENNAIPKYLTKLLIDSNLVEKQRQLVEYGEKINQTINDISIVIENSVFE